MLQALVKLQARLHCLRHRSKVRHLRTIQPLQRLDMPKLWQGVAEVVVEAEVVEQPKLVHSLLEPSDRIHLSCVSELFFHGGAK